MADDSLEPREFTRTWQVPSLDSREMKIYRGFPQRLHHKVPHWVEPGAFFHVRVALDREKAQNPFNKSSVGESDFGFSKIVRSQDAMAHHALSFDGLITYMRCYLSGAMDR